MNLITRYLVSKDASKRADDTKKALPTMRRGVPANSQVAGILQ